MVFHHPAYTSGEYQSTPAVADRWVPLFERHGVDLVLSGHDHNYQRFARREGVRYVVSGGGGARVYALHACPAGYPHLVAGAARRSFLYLLVRSGGLRVRAVTPGGTVLDRFSVYP